MNVSTTPCTGARTGSAFAKWLAVAAMAIGAAAASAQAYPTRTVSLVVPFNAGTSPDIIARELASSLEKKLGHAVIVENKPGAGTLLGSRFAANAAPDGHTLFVNGSSSILAPVLNPASGDKGYVSEMAHVSTLAFVPNMMGITSTLPVRTMGEFIAYLHANPGKVSYASPGIGSSPHLQIELFKMLTKTDITHVPYKGYDSLYSDLVSGRVHMTVAPFGGMKPHVDAGKLRILAVTTPQRVPGLPDFPTAVEAGVAGFSVVPWIGISAPKGTPSAIVARLNQHIQEALNEPSMLARLKTLALEPMRGSVQDFQAFVQRDAERWAQVVKDSHIKIE
ncbi:Bug family tripartite tricarboxylate transporter substrate binding protein [Pseudorhodoferax sp.]|uniref:Bug family tripartite tricarboxylate transporter substrate binding protein n=1 Tax=Pseudorhodoferax sp. TaxID=1993553 RepID=UPI002DD6BA57|nr:tripartite tricarboxylate transporter substrate binding protein [Pseudorhodoferax sp.]